MEFEADIPAWLGSRGTIDEVAFCQQFRKELDVIYDRGAFFSREGRIPDEQVLRREIYNRIAPYISTNIHRRVDSLMAALRLDSGKYKPVESPVMIHVANGTYHLDEDFSQLKHYCRHRLNAKYDPMLRYPQVWLDFLEDLLEPEDILTLQEFMGYCLIPTTVAQKMLIITGRGGEGKSRIGVVMKAIFGEAMAIGSLAKVETNRFARADLEHLLVFVDDDLKLGALPDTNHIKSIITAETPIDLEKKGQQSYQGQLNVRFIAFGNDTLQALHDRSYGFFRRQIILSAKPIRHDRKTDPLLGVRLKQEIDGIFLWCLEGLYRLTEHNFQFTISEKAKQNLERSMSAGNNILDFMNSEGYFRYDSCDCVAFRLFYDIYRNWCADNGVTPITARSFANFLSQNLDTYHLTASNKIHIGNGKYARGYQGIHALPRM